MSLSAATISKNVGLPPAAPLRATNAIVFESPLPSSSSSFRKTAKRKMIFHRFWTVFLKKSFFTSAFCSVLLPVVVDDAALRSPSSPQTSSPKP